ncbi:hypothetical protein B0J13DRAFT_534034 [Dactylonectria estremocensis]|uniref:Uncharacterized protein n=1 Tax=Dactylonectria estremocensis TaxID=1079267 RepID=A0A9P9I936_9HYPO|nr:hypothetical protein B0J13DRAFT_534034 [Dactylonectria estremocensis]
MTSLGMLDMFLYTFYIREHTNVCVLANHLRREGERPNLRLVFRFMSWQERISWALSRALSKESFSCPEVTVPEFIAIVEEVYPQPTQEDEWFSNYVEAFVHRVFEDLKGAISPGILEELEEKKSIGATILRSSILWASETIPVKNAGLNIAATHKGLLEAVQEEAGLGIPTGVASTASDASIRTPSTSTLVEIDDTEIPARN